MPKEKKKRRGLKALLIVLGVLAVIVIAFAVFITGGKNSTLALNIGSVDMSKVPDGVCVGSYSAMRWSTSVEVTVNGHRITGIEVTKPQVFATEETIGALTEAVLQAQTPDVDAVSGATVDSHAFLKAVENALNSAAVS